MPGHDVEAQFMIEVREDYRRLFEQHGDRASNAFARALAVAFGHPLDVMAELHVRFTDRFQLLEANGQHPRVPSNQEIQGVMIGAAVALVMALDAQPVAFNIKPGRITDA